MRLAVLADIHSNYIALERCMEYLSERGIENFLFLGDYVGEMAYPERTMKLLYDYRERYKCIFIRGNKEGYWIKYRVDGATGWREYDSTTGVLWYAYHHLADGDIDFFENMPIARKLQFGSLPPLTACHGSPASEREAMQPGEKRTEEILEQAETDLILCAHTHKQGKFTHRGKTMLNPGSVGHSLGAEGKSQFLILHGEEGKGECGRSGRDTICGGWKEEFIALDYDREEAIRQLAESGLAERAPYWCKITEYSLRGGSEKIHHAKVLERVMKLCEEDTGKCNWPDISEKYWEMAIKEFFP